ncbi:hypothetical protein SHPE106448_20480 [Shewanella pealeana]
MVFESKKVFLESPKGEILSPSIWLGGAHDKFY